MLEADREIGVERLHEASPSSISRCTASNTKVDNRMAVSIGCSKSDLDTPALCIDLDAMESNAAEMSQACRDRNLAWRPHSKCHKSPDIGRKLVQAGAIGLTCAKLGEAEVLGQGGINDLLIANMIVGPQKLDRLAALRRIADPMVCIDHEDQLRPLSSRMEPEALPVRVLVEVDIGLARVGCQPGQATVELARLAHELPGVELAGIMGYEGHLLTLQDLDEKRQRIAEALGCLVETAEAVRADGLPCEIVSCGGTGSFLYSVEAPGISELQAGGAIFMDEFYRRECRVDNLRHALTVVATVVSRPTEERAIVDAGRKTMHGDFALPRIIDRDDLEFVRLSAEHGEIRCDKSGPGVRIGDRLEIIPGYSDMTTVLHNEFFAFRNNQLEAVWPLDGRGKLQ